MKGDMMMIEYYTQNLENIYVNNDKISLLN